ncbi:deoxyribonuclease IV [Dictyoglomus thermophilum]|uniref:Endonuclease IV n=2 Tax=Dictyoglomus thermophilum TaxID=14 RepID=B5YCD4_DICT6|nr:deoxyribonuclease IV [Dictyoglomus thermophilum]ACI19831.1 endonuclease IV [Dictyoglomus thermophilum H-6-12]MCX7720845.1 deoxyribonuclease IV [Dictyoglomus thermophilum]
MTKNSYKLGVHLFRGGRSVLEDIKLLRINTAQLFSGNPRSYKPTNEKLPIFPFNSVFIHAPYVVNIASPDEKVFNLSIKKVIEELRLAEELDWEGLIIHPGSSKKMGKEVAKKNFFKALEKILEEDIRAKLIVENSAGEGDGWGSTLEDFYSIYEEFPVVYFCIDTCHLFAAGYNLKNPRVCQSIFHSFFEKIPMEKLVLIHVNDSHFPLGSHRDQHAHIGKGAIGIGGFKNLLSIPEIRKIPLILETPKDTPMADLYNLHTIRKILENSD